MQRVRENGIDGIGEVLGAFGLAVVGLLVWQLGQQVWGLWALVGFGLVGGCCLHTSLMGKKRIWDRLVAELPLTATTRALDVGCGHGMVLLKLAVKLPRGGQVTGIDIWRQRDQTHNSLVAAQDRIAAAGVQDRARVQTADMRDLPFRDQSFNLVVSNLAIHNVKTKAARLASLQELGRVLMPGGRVVIVDLGFACQEYHEALRQLGFTNIRVTGNGYAGWWGGPWCPTLTLTANKPVRSAEDHGAW